MQADLPKEERLQELRRVISKMPVSVCCTTVLPDLGLHWKQVAQAVKDCHLPIEPASIAFVLSQHLVKSLPCEELDEILAKLKLRLVAVGPRSWHAVHLHGAQLAGAELADCIPRRVRAALREHRRGMTTEVQSLMFNGLIYLSVQFVSASKQTSPLYIATPPGHPVALVSSMAAERLLKGCVEALGFSSCTVANLHGSHIPSLLRIADSAWVAAPDQVVAPAPYAPKPVLTENGIDYTGRTYDEQYVDNILGPDPPLLTSLTIKTTSDFFNRSLMNKTINLTINLKSDNVADTLKGWVVMGALAADSTFIQIFHKHKSNKITFNKNDEDFD